MLCDQGVSLAIINIYKWNHVLTNKNDNCDASELNFVSLVYTIDDLRFHNSFT